MHAHIIWLYVHIQKHFTYVYTHTDIEVTFLPSFKKTVPSQALMLSGRRISVIWIHTYSHLHLHNLLIVDFMAMRNTWAPKTMFLWKITSFLGSQNHYFSWFWGPIVTIYIYTHISSYTQNTMIHIHIAYYLHLSHNNPYMQLYNWFHPSPIKINCTFPPLPSLNVPF